MRLDIGRLERNYYGIANQDDAGYVLGIMQEVPCPEALNGQIPVHAVKILQKFCQNIMREGIDLRKYGNATEDFSDSQLEWLIRWSDSGIARAWGKLRTHLMMANSDFFCILGSRNNSAEHYMKAYATASGALESAGAGPDAYSLHIYCSEAARSIAGLMKEPGMQLIWKGIEYRNCMQVIEYLDGMGSGSYQGIASNKRKSISAYRRAAIVAKEIALMEPGARQEMLERSIQHDMDCARYSNGSYARRCITKARDKAQMLYMEGSDERHHKLSAIATRTLRNRHAPGRRSKGRGKRRGYHLNSVIEGMLFD